MKILIIVFILFQLYNINTILYLFMIIDNFEEEESNIRTGLPIVKIYNCNKKFKNKTLQSNKFNLFKNYASLMKFHNKFKVMIKETKPISIERRISSL